LNPQNTSGTMGVSWYKDRKKWYARISSDDEVIFLGMFDHKEDAIAARKAAEVKYGYHPNHGKVLV